MLVIKMFITAVCVLFLVKLRWPKKESFTESFTSGNMTFGAPSYEPDQPG